MKKYFVIGNPISHSLSPKLHNHWLEQNNINAAYEKIKLEENEIENFIINDKKGIKKQAYDKISRSLDIVGQYRTYDYLTAIKSAVYLEPIRVFTDVRGS